MGTILASEIVNRVAQKLLDDGFDVWSEAEILADLNAGQRQIVSLLPRSYSRAADLTLTAESTRQTLPDQYERLIRLVRNAPGRSITRMDLSAMDRQFPYWHDDEPAGEVRQYGYDFESDSRGFYVYPAPSSAITVEAIVTRIPEPVTLTDPVRLSDLHAEPLYYYCLQQAYTKSTSSAIHVNKANNFGQMFMQLLGLKKVAHLSEPAQ